MSDQNVPPPVAQKKKRRKKLSPQLKFFRKYHAYFFLVIVFGALGMAYIDNDPSSTASRMTSLGHPRNFGERGTLYAAGADDIYTIFFISCLFFVVRWLINVIIFTPLMKCLAVEKHNRHKFLDQGWQFVWYTLSFGLSLYHGWDLMRLDPEQGFVGQNNPDPEQNPHIYHTMGFKIYYLMEVSFWTHMIFSVLFLDVWGKDVGLYIAHHIVTSSLCITSWYLNFSWIGTLILVEQDFADMFLPLAKMLNYANLNTAADAVFASFAVAWIPSRHGVYFWILYHIYHSHEVVAHPFRPEVGGYHSSFTINGYLVFLCLLQVLLLCWLRDVLIAVYKALVSDHVDDHTERETDSESDADAAHPKND